MIAAEKGSRVFGNWKIVAIELPFNISYFETFEEVQKELEEQLKKNENLMAVPVEFAWNWKLGKWTDSGK